LTTNYSCSLRAFLRLRLRANASFTALLLARFQVERVTFHFLDDVFLLHLAFEAAQSVLEGFTLLNSDLRQTLHPPTRPLRTFVVIARFAMQSQVLSGNLVGKMPPPAMSRTGNSMISQNNKSIPGWI